MALADIIDWFNQRVKEADVEHTNKLTSVELLGIAQILAVDLHRIADALEILAEGRHE